MAAWVLLGLCVGFVVLAFFGCGYDHAPSRLEYARGARKAVGVTQRGRDAKEVREVIGGGELGTSNTQHPTPNFQRSTGEEP